MTIGNPLVEMNDYEVLGVGAERRQALIENHPGHFYRLIRHSGLSFLPGTWESTLDWLKPEEILEINELPKERLLREAFFRLFPQGTGLLGDSAGKLLNDYLKEMPWDEGLLEDHFRYFPFFLRRRLPQHSLWMEVFLWEAIQNSLTYLDFGGGELSSEPGLLRVNPGLMTLKILESAAVLKRNSGLYAYAYSETRRRVVEVPLSPVAAAILDLLAEDRKFNREQLIDMLKIENIGDSVEIFSTLDSLIQRDIIRGNGI